MNIHALHVVCFLQFIRAHSAYKSCAVTGDNQDAVSVGYCKYRGLHQGLGRRLRQILQILNLTDAQLSLLAAALVCIPDVCKFMICMSSLCSDMTAKTFSVC